MKARHCEVCDRDISRDHGRCTNGRCTGCHAAHCTPGGDVTPGHGRLWPAEQAAQMQAARQRIGRRLADVFRDDDPHA